jgi:hypothetical protein
MTMTVATISRDVVQGWMSNQRASLPDASLAAWIRLHGMITVDAWRIDATCAVHGMTKSLIACSERGAEIATDIHGPSRFTIGHLAGINGHRGCFRVWLDAKPVINAVDDDGCTAGHHLAMQGHWSMLTMWLRAGGDGTIADRKGYSVGDWILWKGHGDISTSFQIWIRCGGSLVDIHRDHQDRGQWLIDAAPISTSQPDVLVEKAARSLTMGQGIPPDALRVLRRPSMQSRVLRIGSRMTDPVHMAMWFQAAAVAS